MKDVYICFSRAKSEYAVFSKGIQLLEKRKYGHAFIRYTDTLTGVTMVAQASHGIVNEMNYDVFLTKNIMVKEYKLECNDVDFIKLMTFIKKNMGIPYGNSQILMILVKKLINFEIESYNKEKYFICSEFAGFACSILNLQMPEHLDYVTPSDLDTLLHTNNIPSTEYL